VPSWELSTTLDKEFCIKALDDALKISIPDIFNTDQGSQFTSAEFTGRLEDEGIKVSMDCRGRAWITYLFNAYGARSSTRKSILKATERSARPAPLLPLTFGLIPGRASTSLLTAVLPMRYITIKRQNN
jgi:transposase InsO family protein